VSWLNAAADNALLACHTLKQPKASSGINATARQLINNRVRNFMHQSL